MVPQPPTPAERIAALEEWRDALRSGKYEQGTKALRTHDNKYCCLGVACDLFKDRIDAHWSAESITRLQNTEDGPGPYTFHTSHGGEEVTGILPNVLAEFLFGPTEWDYEPDTEGHRVIAAQAKEIFATELSQQPTRALTDANDDGMGFSQIADLIDRYIAKVKEEHEEANAVL